MDAENTITRGMPKYISLKEVAQRVGMDRNTIRRHLQKAGIRALTIGRCVRYREDEVSRFIEDNTEASAGD